MLSLSLIRQIDRAWLTALGLLGACGPQSAAMSGTGTTSGDAATGEHASTTGSTTEPTTGPGSTTGSTTGSTGSTEPTTTTGPAPECVADRDCFDACFCIDGTCVPCHRPYHDCYTDNDCSAGHFCYSYDCILVIACGSNDDCPEYYECGNGTCFPVPQPMMLPSCPPAQVDVSQWDLTNTPSALGLGDLDGDGDLDVFAALPAVAAIELAFNDGAGMFTPGGVIDVGPPQTDMRVAAGDLDGDAHVDLAVARADSSDLVVLFGMGGVFAPGPLLPASAPPRTITAMDLDGDGDNDLVTIGGNFDSVSVWIGDGVGGFAPEQIFVDLTDSVASTIQNIDLDDIPDLLALPAAGAPEVLKVYRGTPNVAWLLEKEIQLDAPTWTQALTGELGGAPAPELVLLRVEGDGGLAKVWDGFDPFVWTSPQAYLTASPLAGGVFADGDSDFSVDLIAATGGPTISVLLGDAVGGFWCERIHDVLMASSLEVLAAGELDGDQGAELVVGSRDGPSVMVFRAL